MTEILLLDTLIRIALANLSRESLFLAVLVVLLVIVRNRCMRPK